MVASQKKDQPDWRMGGRQGANADGTLSAELRLLPSGMRRAGFRGILWVVSRPSQDRGAMPGISRHGIPVVNSWPPGGAKPNGICLAVCSGG